MAALADAVLRDIVAGTVAELRTDVAGFTHLRAAGGARGRPLAVAVLRDIVAGGLWLSCIRTAAALRAMPVAGPSLRVAVLRGMAGAVAQLRTDVAGFTHRRAAGSARGRLFAVAVLRDIMAGAVSWLSCVLTWRGG